MSKYTVLHCFHKYLHTTENWAYRIIEALPDSQIIILSKRYLRNNFYSDEFKYIEFPLMHIETVNGKEDVGIKCINKCISLIRNNVYKIYVRKMLSDVRIDVMHSHFAMVGWDYRWLAKKLKVPHVISFYGLDYEHVPYVEPVWKRRYQILFEEADIFLCEGRFGAHILQEMGCPKEKVRVVRLGVDTEKIPFFKRTKKSDELRLLQIANLGEKKGHVYTMEAFAKAIKTCPNMTLTIVGKGEKESIREKIAEIIKQNNIMDKVTILDWIDFCLLHEFMRDYQVFIHPSCYAETRDCEGGAPVVLLDAQATGMPVISTTHCDIPDEVINGKSGYLTPEKDTEALSHSIRTFYDMDNETYQSFASNARKHIEDNYSVRKNSEILQQVYVECINSRKTS